MVPAEEFVDIADQKTHVITWSNCNSSSKGLVVVFHGFLAHATYPTVRYAAELLQDEYTVVAADMPGHGQSPGIAGYMDSSILKWAAAMLRYAVSQHTPQTTVLLGSSLGGALALLAADQEEVDFPIDGIVLLAPMMGLKNLSAIERKLLYGLTCCLPNQWALIPSSATDAAKQYRDPDKRKECEEMAGDTKYLCLGSAYACVDLVQRVQNLSTTTPIFMGVADEDVVVDSDAAIAWFEKNKGENSELKRYPALHGLLCEPSPLLETIQNDLLVWVRERTKAS